MYLAWYEAIRDIAGSSGISLGLLNRFPSWTTFHHRWYQKWSCVLTFRKASQHKECSLCHDFRCAVHRRGVPTSEKVAIARQWREHVRAQYHDRLLYWSLRWASRMFQDVLVIIIGSMDKVKTMYPMAECAHGPLCPLSSVTAGALAFTQLTSSCRTGRQLFARCCAVRWAKCWQFHRRPAGRCQGILSSSRIIQQHRPTNMLFQCFRRTWWLWGISLQQH